MIDYEPDYASHPPCNMLWVDDLRWLICVMSGDDKSFPFVANCFAQCLKHGGLTKKQGHVISTIVLRVQKEYEAGVLPCQASGKFRNSDLNLASVETKGEA